MLNVSTEGSIKIRATRRGLFLVAFSSTWGYVPVIQRPFQKHCFGVSNVFYKAKKKTPPPRYFASKLNTFVWKTRIQEAFFDN